MKKLILIAALLILPAGCALFQPAEIPVATTLPPAAQAVQKTINEVNVLITAAANVVAQNAVDGISTKAQAQGELDKLRDFSKRADAAQKLLDTGNILDAKTQAELLSKAIVLLHKEVAARRSKK